MEKNNKVFYLHFPENCFNKGYILIPEGNCVCKVKVLEIPHKKWYKQLLQFITFGLYKAPTQYKVKLLEE